MADRRMFAKAILYSDAFLDLSDAAKVLYVYLCLFADDDGFCNSTKSVLRQTGAPPAALQELRKARFVLPFSSNLIVVRHWRVHNKLRPDRHIPTVYQAQLASLCEDEAGAFHFPGRACGKPVDNLTSQVRSGREIRSGQSQGEREGGFCGVPIPETGPREQRMDEIMKNIMYGDFTEDELEEYRMLAQRKDGSA